MKKILITTLAMSALLLGIVFTSPAPVGSAVPGYMDFLPAWSHVGSAFTVDEGSATKYAMGTASFGFKTGQISSTGLRGILNPIVARCNVTNPLDSGNPGWNALIVDYLDPDGTGTNYRVYVILYRLDRSTGSVSTVAKFDSNTVALTTRGERQVIFTHAMDFLNNEYFVQVQVYRADTSGSPVVNAVRLALSYQIPS